MKFKTAFLWSLVNGSWHPSLSDREKTIGAMTPLIDTLFPGIDYFSISGHDEVMRSLVIPALLKLCPDLLTVPGEKVYSKATMEVDKVLSSKGFEWQSSSWKEEFVQFLAR